MAVGTLFGTDGIRGQAGEKLTPELAARAAYGLACALNHPRRHKPAKRPVIVVGEDSRLSSPMLRSAVSSGAALGGFDVYELGTAPTPLVPFTILKEQLAGGVMITASHNPTPDNGIKLFGPDGLKLSRRQELVIERVIGSRQEPKSAELYFGQTQRLSMAPAYLSFLRKAIHGSRSKRTLKIVLDCAYGATCELAPAAFKSRGYKVTSICDTFDGSRVNHKCGATDLGKVGSAVRKAGADLGLAFDGDGDRVLAVDERGRPVSGDIIIALFATRLRRYRSQGAVVMTKMTNLGVEEALRKRGVRLIRTEVGDINVLAEMRRRELNLGGEQSGHIIMWDKHVAGDGILSGLQLAAVVGGSAEPLSVLAAGFPQFPQLLVNLEVKDKLAWQANKKFAKRLKQIMSSYPDVRLYLRPSGTQELIRVLTESRDNNCCRKANQAVCEALLDLYH